MKKFAAKPLIYVAGPISKGDFLGNIGNGIDVGERIAAMGMVPFIPHLDILWCLRHPKTKSWEERLQYDEQVLARCDALFRIPGPSRGAAREERFARSRGVPIFHDLKEMRAALL